MDLSLVPIKDLADELMRRADCGVIIFKTFEEEEVYINWIGDYYGALGMCVEMQNQIINEKDES